VGEEKKGSCRRDDDTSCICMHGKGGVASTSWETVQQWKIYSGGPLLGGSTILGLTLGSSHVVVGGGD
jgi:hypothetical protein